MARPFLAIAALAAAALGGACSAPAPPAPAPVVGDPAPAARPEARLPRPGERFAPAQVTTDDAVTGTALTETEGCAGCHAQAAADWRASPHAFGSFNNPIYRVVVDRFRAEVGDDASRFCGGCHDVALLVDGAMSRDVAPSDPRAHGGVACRVCHGIEAARPDGNGSYALTGAPIPIPRDGDDASLQAHKARMALAPLRTAAMCGSCHRSFLSPETGNPAHLTGQDELGAWERSAYAGSDAARIDPGVPRAECRTCHMPLEDAPLGDAAARGGKVHSHRFAGGNTWLAAMRGDEAQLRAVQGVLRSAASLDVAVATSQDGAKTLPADGAPVRPGEAITLDVVVRNTGAGHRFPAGVLDAQDTWIEVEVRDALGRRLAEAGADEEATDRDPTAHVLRSAMADAHGTPLLLRETQRFRASAYNHTIAPRDAEAVRYRLDVPPDLQEQQLPLRVVARLRHRSRDLELYKAVCADAKTPRGTAFLREVAARTDARFDPCRPEPVTEIARAEVSLGAGPRDGAGGVPADRAAARLYDDGIALLHAQQENVDDARASLERALDLAPGGSMDRAAALHALALVAIGEGRTDEALRRLDEAQDAARGLGDAATAPELARAVAAAVASARAQALAGIWRWRDAVAPLEQAVAASPLDDALLSRLAVAAGSADEPWVALDAARRGLALAPRDADMLRVQALALDRLGAPPDDAAAARDAFARWRPPDDAPGIKSACSRQAPGCALERLPVHVHALRPAR
jgi:tetratricopeptide (TPR) repeat protein